MSPTSPEVATFIGVDGVRLVADVWGCHDGRTVLMLHGGGQTRHSWRSTALMLAGRGLRVVTLDARGHGDSSWSPDGVYALGRLRDDALAVLNQLAAPAVLVGASLGGLTAIHVARTAGPDLVPGLVLVDVVPRVEETGASRIRAFMARHGDGFASLHEAASAVAEYLPHRARPRSTEGLTRNLRRRDDGRWYWHWDPRFLEGRQGDLDTAVPGLEQATRELTMPLLLLRGRLSDVVSDRGVTEFQQLLPHAEVLTLDKAAHTAAGDDNDAFSRAVVDFCTRATA